MESNFHRLIIALCLAIALASLYGIYYVSNNSIGGYSVESSIAFAETVEKEVKRKPMGSFSWYSVSTGGQFGFRDTVFVGPGSNTTLALDDGTKLTLSENSLIILDTGSLGNDPRSAHVAEIRLVRGDVAIQKSASAKELKLVLGKSSIGIKSGSSVAVGKSAKGIDLVVKKGQVNLVKDSEKKSEAIEFKPKTPSRITDLDLEAEFNEITKRISETETVAEDTTTKSESESLLKMVPQKEESKEPEVETSGELENFAKEMSMEAARKVAAIPPPEPAPIEIPVELKIEPPPPPPEPTKVLDLSKRNSYVIIDLPKDVNFQKKKHFVEMSFDKEFNRKLKFPLDPRRGASTYKVVSAYLLEVPGFRKGASKYPRLYWRIVNPKGNSSDAKWVAIRGPKSTVLRMPASLRASVQEGEATVPLKWDFKGIFVEKFKIVVSDSKDFNQVLCETFIPNQNFVDPTIVEVDDQNLTRFTYSLRSDDNCKFALALQSNKKLFLQIVPVDPDGKVIRSAGSKYDSIVLAR